MKMDKDTVYVLVMLDISAAFDEILLNVSIY